MGYIKSLLISILFPAASTALGQSDGYRVPVVENAVEVLAVVCAIVALAGICVVAFKDSHRTHLD